MVNPVRDRGIGEKGFKPHISLINQSLQIADNAHQRAILEIVQTLSDAQKRHVKVPAISEDVSVAGNQDDRWFDFDNNQSEDGRSQPDISSHEPNHQASGQSWRGAAQLLEKVAGTVCEFVAVQAIHQALAEVCQSEKRQILKLAQEALDLESLAPIEAAF